MSSLFWNVQSMRFPLKNKPKFQWSNKLKQTALGSDIAKSYFNFYHITFYKQKTANWAPDEKMR